MMEAEISIQQKLFSNELRDEWERYVATHPDGSIFHHPGWLIALEAENGQPVTCLVSKNESGNISGVMPLLFTKGIPGNIGKVAGSRRVSSLPRTPHCGPLADTPEISQVLLTSASRLLSAAVPRLQCKSLDPTLAMDGLKLQKLVWRETFIKKIPPAPAALTFGNPRNNRRITTSIRKAMSSGVSVREIVDKKEVGAWYRLYVKTMQRHLVPARSSTFFFTLWDELKEQGFLKLFGAYQCSGTKSNMVAGSLFLMYKDKGYYAFNGCTAQGKLTRANDLLIWHFFNVAKSLKLEEVDLGEVSDVNQGLAAFKNKWGVEKQPIFHYYFPPIDLLPESNKRSLLRILAGGIWKMTPPSITAVIGRTVNRYL